MKNGSDDVGGNTAGSKPHRPKKHIMHGLSQRIRGRSTQLHGNSAVVRAMADYKADLVASLGGLENLSSQELTLVEMCAKDWLLLQDIDAYLLQVGSYNRKKRQAYPLLASRCQIADSLTRKLQALGLSRRSKPINSLAALLSGSLTQSSNGGIPHE